MANREIKRKNETPSPKKTEQLPTESQIEEFNLRVAEKAAKLQEGVLKQAFITLESIQLKNGR